MNGVKVRELVPCSELLKKLPLPAKDSKNISKHRQDIKNILAGKDNRLLLIIGPCSAWPNTAVLDYAKRLANLANKYKDKIKIVMRVYPHKPRTAIGWQGALLQPDPFKSPDINAGLHYCREMMLKVAALDLPIAAEILNPNLHEYFIDLLSWVAIGARSSENQEHRIFASSLDIAVGIKNPTHGNLNVAVDSIISAQHTHAMVHKEAQFDTSGNQFAHLVLRGANKQHNYDLNSLNKVYEHLITAKATNPSTIIDVSHDNCHQNQQKNHKSQPEIINEIMHQTAENSPLQKFVKGFMVESFINCGRQDLNNESLNMEGLSITDACIGWSDTEKLIENFARQISLLYELQ